MVRHWFMTGALIIGTVTYASAQTPAKLAGAPDIVPPATEAMQKPDFWIAQIANPDKIIMTAEEIAAFNTANRTSPLVRNDVNGKPVAIDSITVNGNFAGIMFHLSDPLAIGTFPGERVKQLLTSTETFLTKTDFWDRRQIPYPLIREQELIDAMNISEIPAAIRPRYGIIVCHTLNRIVPTHDKVYGGQFQWLDIFQNATLETGMPIAILHETKKGDWLYVRSEYTYGWVPAENVATGAKEAIGKLSAPKDFIVATDHKIPVYADKNCSVWLTDLYMGERLGFRSKKGTAFAVAVPFRKPDGGADTVPGWVRGDARVSIGYQPYTQRNVIETFFRLLNRPYGWGGTDHERDCVGTIRDVFRTFGIFMPRWTTFELYQTPHVISFPANTPKAEKYRYLDSCEPGITVCGFNWHVVLYLGKVDDTHYIIHQNGYSYHGQDGTEYRVGRVSVNYTELEGGADINNWTELSTFKK